MQDPATGAPIPGNDATATIVKRADGSEIKEWEALGRYVNVQSNGGNLPARYSRSGGTFPRRALCVGANSSNPAGGNCSH